MAVVHDGTVAYAVERDTVGFVLFIEGKAGVFQTNVLQRARVVGIIVAAVNGTAYFRTSLAAFGIGVGASADVDASPCARLFFFAGHYDGFVRRAYGVDFTALLHEDVVCDVIVNGDNLHAFFYVERATFFYDVFAAQLVGVSGFRVTSEVMVPFSIVPFSISLPFPLPPLPSLSLLSSLLQAVRIDIPATKPASRISISLFS